DAGALGQVAQVEDARVRVEPTGAVVEHREVLRQRLGDVVRGEQRVAGGRREPLGAHERDVGPGDGQHPGRAVPGGGDGWPAVGVGGGGVAGQEGDEVLPHRHRPDTGTATAVRDAERLVEVEVGDVPAELPGLGEADQRVEVRTVDVPPPAGGLDGLAHLAHLGVEDAVRGGVGEHDRGQLLGVLVDLRAQVGDVDGAVLRRL